MSLWSINYCIMQSSYTTNSSHVYVTSKLFVAYITFKCVVFASFWCIDPNVCFKFQPPIKQAKRWFTSAAMSLLVSLARRRLSITEGPFLCQIILLTVGHVAKETFYVWLSLFGTKRNNRLQRSTL